MKMKHWAVGALALLAAATVQAAPKPASSLGTELQTAEFEGFDSVRVAGPLNFGEFTSVYVAQPELNFADYWLRKNRVDLTQRDEERIRRDYSRILKSELEKSLAKNTGLEVVNSPSPDSLVITPRIERFRLTAPDLRGALKRDFVDYVGSAEIVLRLSRGSEGDVLAELADHRQTRTFLGVGDLKPTNRAVNRQDFKWLFRKWANRTSEFLKQTESAV